MKKRANSVISTTSDETTMTFMVDGFEPLVLDLEKVHADLLNRAAFHGFKQRVSDAAAIPCDSTTGKPASPADKWAAMKQIVDHLNSGTSDWNIKRAAGERGDGGAVVVQALGVLWKMPVEAVVAKLQAVSARSGLEVAAIVKKFAGAADVMREVAAIKAARSGVDADELLEELGE